MCIRLIWDLGVDVLIYTRVCVVAALMYSAFGVVLSKARGADDELNTLASGFLTGLAYKSSGNVCYIELLV